MNKPSVKKLYQQLDQCMLSARYGFYRQLQNFTRNKNADIKKLENIAENISRSIIKTELRKNNCPAVSYPENLPVSQKKDLILKTIQENQVTILCGETGSGKTTQLPKICLQAGLGIRGLIGHTQPRRLAARSVASRIAEELKTELGQSVGYKVRFSDRLTDESYIKLMTDGILLAEIHHDPYLNQYDCIIIDEAHERSLNIDFILGYLRQLLPKRRDLKVIITSATIDPERFAKHFNNAPIIEVSGRTYPVEVLYQPLHGEDDDEKQKDFPQAIADAVDFLSRKDRSDILVFLSGERDIRETADYLKKQNLQNTDILPLLARLSASEQNKIFHTSSKRRIILSTNVAETSLTVPGIKYVIDSGVARISRYSWRSKIQRLPIEKISQASANQRKGRCGRISEGTCIRLYSEDDFNLRDEFTAPEIQRTNLAAVILQMENMQVGHVEDFPFVEPPDGRLVRDGYKLLHELGAINTKNKITTIGKKLARLPIDPKLGRMLLEAEQESSLNEVLIIVAALASQDPKERPMDKQQAADESHKKFKDDSSDFIGFLNLWNSFHKQQQNLSGNKLRKWCKENFISWMRMREWKDTHQQITNMLKELKLKFNQNNADYSSIHRALLTGLLSNLGLKSEDREYTGARNGKFMIFPGSALFKKSPKWIMSAEIVETSRVYARTTAKIEPLWIEDKAKHLFKRNYSQPHWEKRNAQVSAFEQTTLYGLIINPKRKTNYGPINPAESREIFIRSALVQGDFNCNFKFFIHNQKLINELENLEAKSRRQDIIIDDEILFQFYNPIIPSNIYSGPQFNKWLKKCDEKITDTLLLSKEYLMQHDAEHITDEQFPNHIEVNGSYYPLEYHFDPGHNCDGITIITPTAGLNALNPQICEWLVPGMLHEKMVALIRSLPKQLRKNFVPAPNFADACLQSIEPGDISLSTAMSNHLRKITGTEIPYDAWRPELLDAHLFMNFRIIDNKGKTVKEDRNLQHLKSSLDDSDIVTNTEEVTHDIEQENVKADILDNIPDTIEINLHGVKIKGFPALVKEGKNVALRVLDSKNKAIQKHKSGLRQLYINAIPEQIKQLKSNLPDIHKLCMLYTSIGKCDNLKQDFLATVIDELFTQHEANSKTDFEKTLSNGRAELHSTAENWSHLLSEIFSLHKQLRKSLKNPPLSWLDAITDIQDQLNHLLQPGFILNTEKNNLQQYPRYLIGIQKRLEKIQGNPERDRISRLQVSALWQEYKKRQQALAKQHTTSAQLEHYRWMLEEYRVSLFAQELKTQFPISEKRLKIYWNDISDA
jgi:ATP-dependent helicase HrpA